MDRLFKVKYPNGDTDKIRIWNGFNRKDCIYQLYKHWNIKEESIISEKSGVICKHCKGTGTSWKTIKKR